MNALPILLLLLAPLAFQQTDTVLEESPYFQAHKNSAPCAVAGAKGCGTRIIVALGNITLGPNQMRRGDIRVYASNQPYAPPTGGDYVEVAVKPDHPAVVGSGIDVDPEGNDIIYNGTDLVIFEEKLDVGATRERHGHAERTVIQLNDTMLEITPEGGTLLERHQVPDTVGFRDPTVHVVKNVGPNPLRNIVIELRP